MSEYKDWVEQHQDNCDTCMELGGRIGCQHQCTSDCRRNGCNCQCGECHLDMSPQEAYIKLNKHLEEEAEKADAQFQALN